MDIFNLAYQQKINANEIVSIEALLRPLDCMNVEEYVKTYPNPIELDKTVIMKVLEDIITFDIPVPVSINVCYLSFLNNDFIDFCIAKLQDFNVYLELTEHNKIEDVEILKFNIDKLRAAGILVSLDDFGKHFINVNVITEILFDQIKIDKSLIDGIENDFLRYKKLSLLTEKIKTFGIHDIIYEGVEKKEQEDVIKIFNQGPTIQGYLYSKPLSIDNMSFKQNNNIDENIEKFMYDLVLTKSKQTCNERIMQSNMFKCIFDSGKKNSTSKFKDVYYYNENKLSINAMFTIINNSEKMVAIRDPHDVVIFENKKHADFFGQPIVGMSVDDVLAIIPEYKYHINDDKSLLDSNEHYSIKKEIFNNISYFTMRQKVEFNNEIFILVTVYEENNSVFLNRDLLTNCLLRDYMKSVNSNSMYLGKVIAFIDLNGFKSINDTYGHDVGDEVLLDFVNILKTNLRNIYIEDQLIRYGGDEFIIIFNSVDDDAIQLKLDEINKQVKDFFKQKNIVLSFSYGLSKNIYNSIERSIIEADKKMYLFKNKTDSSLQSITIQPLS